MYSTHERRTWDKGGLQSRLQMQNISDSLQQLKIAFPCGFCQKASWAFWQKVWCQCQPTLTSADLLGLQLSLTLCRAWTNLSIGYDLSWSWEVISCHLDFTMWFEKIFDMQIPSLKSLMNEARGKGVSGSTINESAKSVTLMPAERHLPTASGTAARGGSIMEMRPRKQSCIVGKFMSSQSKVNPRGNWDEDRFKWQKPGRGERSVRWLFITDWNEISKYTTATEKTREKHIFNFKKTLVFYDPQETYNNKQYWLLMVDFTVTVAIYS